MLGLVGLTISDCHSGYACPSFRLVRNLLIIPAFLESAYCHSDWFRIYDQISDSLRSREWQPPVIPACPESARHSGEIL